LRDRTQQGIRSSFQSNIATIIFTDQVQAVTGMSTLRCATIIRTNSTPYHVTAKGPTSGRPTLMGGVGNVQVSRNRPTAQVSRTKSPSSGIFHTMAWRTSYRAAVTATPGFTCSTTAFPPTCQIHPSAGSPLQTRAGSAGDCTRMDILWQM